MPIEKKTSLRDRFKERGGEYAEKYLAELDSEYEKLKNADIPELTRVKFGEFSRSGNRTVYESDYFLRRTMLRDFALKLWLGDTDAKEPLERIITAVCSEFTWILPAHEGEGDIKTQIDLFAAETAHALSEIITLVGGELSPDVAERAVLETRKRVLEPFVRRSVKYGWENSESNWSAVCGGCIGMTAMYLIPDAAEAKRVANDLAAVFENYMKSFTDDGACTEGLYYWGYGMTYFTAFLDLYRDKFGEEFPVNEKKLAKMASFARKCCISDEITVSFSDSGEHDKIYSGLSSWLGIHFDAADIPAEYKAGFLDDDCGRWCRAARDIVWTRSASGETMPKNSVLPEAQWAVLRGDGMSAAFKGGRNDEPHNHNDVGSFVVIKRADTVLCDIGAGEYTREYFSADRYNVFCCSSSGHSVPVIDGQPQCAGADYRAADFAVTDNVVRADISGAYGIEALKRLERKVELSEKRVTVKDVFITDRQLPITERFITRHGAEITAKGAEIVSDGRVIAALSVQNNCEIRITKHKHREHDGVVSWITAVDFCFLADGETEFVLTVD